MKAEEIWAEHRIESNASLRKQNRIRCTNCGRIQPINDLYYRTVCGKTLVICRICEASLNEIRVQKKRRHYFEQRLIALGFQPTERWNDYTQYYPYIDDEDDES